MSDIDTIYQYLFGKIVDLYDRINSLTTSLTVTGPIKGNSIESVGIIKCDSIQATEGVKCLDLSTNSFPSVENSLTTIQSTLTNISSTPSSTIVTGDLILEDTLNVKATNSRGSALYTTDYFCSTGGGFVISHPIIITRLHIQANHWTTNFSERIFTMFSTKYGPQELWSYSISRKNFVNGDYVIDIPPEYLSPGSYLFLIDRHPGQLTSQSSNDTPIFPEVPFTSVYGIDLYTGSIQTIFNPSPGPKRIWYIGNFSYHAPPTLLADTIGNESKPVQTLYVKKINGLNLYPGIFMLIRDAFPLSFKDDTVNNKPRSILSGSTGIGTLSLQIDKFYPEISLYELEAIGTLKNNIYDQILEITVFHDQLQIGYIIFFLLACSSETELAVSEFKIKVTIGITALGTRGKIYSITEFCNIKHNYLGSDDVNYKYFTSHIINTVFDCTLPNLNAPLSVIIKDVTKINKSALNSVFQTSQCVLKRIY